MIARYLKQQQQTTEGIKINQVHHLNPQSITAPSVFITSFEDTVTQKGQECSPAALNDLFHQRGKQVLQLQSSSQQAPASFHPLSRGQSLPQSFIFHR